jgi:hypothetical protein
MRKLTYVIAFIFIVHFTFDVQNSSARWEKISNWVGTNGAVNTFVSLGNNLFIGTANGVWRSTNNGMNWIQTSLNNNSILSLMTFGNNIFAGTDFYNGVYLTTNLGTSWTQIGLYGYSVSALAKLGNNIFAGTYGHGVFMSTNNGTNWTQTDLNLPATVRCFTTLGNNIFVGTSQQPEPGLVYFSTNNGLNWTLTTLNLEIYNCSVTSLVKIGNTIFAGTESNIYKTTNNGLNWIQAAFYGKFVLALSTYGNHIFAGTPTQPDTGIYRSIDNGSNWTPINEGFNNSEMVTAFLITNDYIFAGTNLSIWRRPLIEVIGIRNISTETPLNYSLSQNFPNPFNPITNIKFNIAKLSYIKIVVYDMMGREVQTLVNESLSPGAYEVNWKASLFSSGVYYYRLTADNFSDTKKMLMIK